MNCCDCCDALLTDSEIGAGSLFEMTLCEPCRLDWQAANPVIPVNDKGKS